DVLALGQRYRSFDPADLRTYNLDVTGGFMGGQSILTLDETPANRAMLGIFQGVNNKPATEQGPRTPGEVRLLVLNGSGMRNQATQATLALASLGFRTDTPSDSPTPILQTTIRYPAGQGKAAQLVGRYLAGPVKLEPTSGIHEVTVLTGPDYVGVTTAPKPED